MGEDTEVGPPEGCPSCGERHADRLVWQEDDSIICQSCGCRYRLEPPDEESIWTGMCWSPLKGA
jgi:hypothetical protein